MQVKDCNGNILTNGDSVKLYRDLVVKDVDKDLKKGTLFEKIKLTDSKEKIEVKLGKTKLLIKAKYVRKKTA